MVQGHTRQFRDIVLKGDRLPCKGIYDPRLCVDLPEALIPVYHPVSNPGGMGEEVPDGYGFFQGSDRKAAVRFIKGFQDPGFRKFRYECRDRIVQAKMSLFP